MRLKRIVKHLINQWKDCPTRFSQYGQDSLIGDVLFRSRPGVFVDVGARDGEMISNTAYLERELGWTGLAIEPHPDLFQKLVVSRRCKCINVAASDQEREAMEFVKFLQEPFGNSGLLSSFVDKARLAAIKHEIISVRTSPLSSLLENIRHIDYLDIDVEGHELSVLKGIDFNTVNIHVIGVESIEGSNKVDTIDAFLKEKGFHPFVHLVSDRFYCFGNSLPSAESFCKLAE